MNKELINYFNNIHYDIDIKYNNFDLIFSGGGFKSFYHIGICKILKKLENENKIKIRNIIGTSSGAISAIIYACNINFELCFEAYYKIKNIINKSDLKNCVIDIFKKYLPKNAYELCNGKIKITVSKFTIFGFQEEIIQYFESNDDLINVLSASINIPLLTSNNIYGQKIKKDICYDGFFSRITPVIYDNDLPQLVIKTYNVYYPSYLILKPNDSYIELLSLRGLLESKNFFKNNINSKKTIYWLEKNNKKPKNIFEKNLYIIIPIIFWFISNL